MRLWIVRGGGYFEKGMIEEVMRNQFLSQATARSNLRILPPNSGPGSRSKERAAGMAQYLSIARLGHLRTFQKEFGALQGVIHPSVRTTTARALHSGASLFQRYSSLTSSSRGLWHQDTCKSDSLRFSGRNQSLRLFSSCVADDPDPPKHGEHAPQSPDPSQLTRKQLRIQKHKEKRRLERQAAREQREAAPRISEAEERKIEVMWSMLPPACPGCGAVYDKEDPKSSGYIDPRALHKQFDLVFQSENEVLQDAAEQQMLWKLHQERQQLESAMDSVYAAQKKREQLAKAGISEQDADYQIYMRDMKSLESRELGLLPQDNDKNPVWHEEMSRRDRNSARSGLHAQHTKVQKPGSPKKRSLPVGKVRRTTDPNSLRCQRCHGFMHEGKSENEEVFGMTNILDIGKMILQSAPGKAQEIKETYRIRRLTEELLLLTGGRPEQAEQLLLLLHEQRQQGLLPEPESAGEGRNLEAPAEGPPRALANLGHTASEIVEALPESIRTMDVQTLKRVMVEAQLGQPMPHSATVYIVLVDLIDLQGSVIPEFLRIAEEFPVVLVGNKVDLLPSEAGQTRVMSWFKQEATRLGLEYDEIVMACARNGQGVREIMDRVEKLMSQQVELLMHLRQKESEHIHRYNSSGIFSRTRNPSKKTSPNSPEEDGSEIQPWSSGTEGAETETAGADAPWLPQKEVRKEIFVVGAANVGKSTFLNQLIRKREIVGSGNDLQLELRAKNRRKRHSKRVGDPELDASLRDLGVVSTFSAADEMNADRFKSGSMAMDRLRTMYLTQSFVPGTTLHLVKFHVREHLDTVFWDTPGVFSPKLLVAHLNQRELRAIHPKKRLRPLTYRLKSGQSMLLGALARIDMVAGKPFLMTAVRSDGVTIHLTNSRNILENPNQNTKESEVPDLFDETSGEVHSEAGQSSRPSNLVSRAWWYLYRVAGRICSPPFTPLRTWQLLSRVQTLPEQPTEDADITPVGVPERPDPKEEFDLSEVPDLVSHEMEIEGAGWRESAKDIVFPGLGWVSVTGVGYARFRVYAPAHTVPTLREPLMPYEALTTSKKWVGRHRTNI